MEPVKVVAANSAEAAAKVWRQLLETQDEPFNAERRAERQLNAAHYDQFEAALRAIVEREQAAQGQPVTVCTIGYLGLALTEATNTVEQMRVIGLMGMDGIQYPRYTEVIAAPDRVTTRQWHSFSGTSDYKLDEFVSWSAQ